MLQTNQVAQPLHCQPREEKIPEFPGAIQCSGIVNDMVVDVSPVGMRGNDKGMFAFQKSGGQFVADTISFLCRDFTGPEGLPYLIGNHIAFLAEPGGLLVQLLCEHKLLIHSKRAALIAADKFAPFSLVGILRIISAVFQAGVDRFSFVLKLKQQGYEIKRGKYTSVKGKGQKRFIRFRTLGEGYSEEEIKAVLAGKAEHHPRQKQSPKEQPFQLLVDIQAKLAEGKGGGYERWAKKHNLKEMSKMLIFLQEQKIGSAADLKERADAALSRYHELGDSIKAAEARLTEIAVLKTHIINYAKTREVYAAYRKAGYSKAFLEAHREEIALHKAAKAAFDEAGLQKLPKVKELDAEFAELLTKKKAAYPDYRKARNEMQELVRAQKNVERFFAEEKDTTEKTQTR